MTRLPNGLNWVLLRMNFLGARLYGKQYATKRGQLGVQVHESSTFLDLMNRFLTNTPFYSNQNLTINSFQDFQMLSTIDKQIVQDHFEAFLSSEYVADNYVEGTTGGTTGKPMRILMPKGRYGFELPVVHSFWNTFGWNFDARGVIRNHQLDQKEKYRINPFTKEVIFDAFRQDDDYIRFTHQLLKRKNIRFVQAYPSSAYQFCKRCKELGLDLSFISAFFTSSEPVHAFQKAFVSTELGIPLFNFYGHSEKLMIAATCGTTDYYHFEPSYGLAELLDEEGNPITEAGTRGELVGSTFNNPGMPLLRYRTGDSAELVGFSCPNCGKKALVVKNIIGHYNDNLVYKTQGYTTTTALNLHSELYETIDGLQYIQESPGKLTVCIKPNEKFDSSAKESFISHFKHAMGDDAEIELMEVSSFRSLANGKYPLLISQLKNESNN